MKIESSAVAMQSQMLSSFSHTTISSMEAHYGSVNNSSSSISLDISSSVQINHSSRVFYDAEENLSPLDKIKKQLIEKLLDLYFGDKLENKLYPKKEDRDTYAKPAVQNPYTNKESKQLIGIVYQHQEEYYQKQTVDFSANVQINTPNQSLNLEISLSFSQELYEKHSTRIVIGNEKLIDPLVINYEEDVNPFENLSSFKFEFDLNNDGEKEWIPMLKGGAGFLAFDKNNNGTIDNGKELFGTISGNGFKDLAVYDKDKNNWIDENDAIFDKLKIWQIDEMGDGSLVSLLDLNIGAIYLGDVQSGYKYQNGIHDTQAIQKSNGFFVREDGTGLGVVSSLDMVV